MNKKDLSAIYSTAFWCLFVVLLFFWLYCVTTSILSSSFSGNSQWLRNKAKKENSETTNRHQNAVE